MPLARGRHFDSRDGFDAPSTIIVNQEFVKRFLPDRDPIGQKLNVCWTVRNPVSVVGVVADTRQLELQTPPNPTIFINNLQVPMYFAQLVVRAAGDPTQITRAVERAIHREDPEQAITHVETMQQVFSDSGGAAPAATGAAGGVRRNRRAPGDDRHLRSGGLFRGAAHARDRHSHGPGSTAARCAPPDSAREHETLAALGIGIGLAGALALTRVLRSLLFETTPADPATLLSVVSAILVIVLVATLIPANRAARIHPIAALRYE